MRIKRIIIIIIIIAFVVRLLTDLRNQILEENIEMLRTITIVTHFYQFCRKKIKSIVKK